MNNIEKLKAENAELRRIILLFLKFLASLNKGWLGKCVADVGLLNEAYLASRKAGIEIPKK